MQKKLTITTAADGISFSPHKKLFKIPSGEYAGRIFAVFQTGGSEIKFTYSDKPYSSWFSLTTVASDAASFPFDAVMDVNGNIHIVYCEQTTNYLVTKKLTFSGGSWSVGSKIYIYNGAVTYAPSVTIENNGTLWISWSRMVSGYYDIQVKSSTDSGATWGSGSSDIGDTLKTGLDAGISKIVISPNDVNVVYTGNGNDIFIRTQPISGGGWSTEYIIATGTNMDEHFDIAVSDDGLLGVVFDSGQLRYREYDGSNWSSVIILEASEATFPQLIFVNQIPVVIYLLALTTDQILVKYTHRRTGSFSTPAILDNRAQQFNNVTLYDSSSAGYADLTGASSNASTADVFHPSSGVMMQNTGDILYLGMEQKFRFLKIILSTAGGGGSVSYSYWDGSNWKGFTPSGGDYYYNAADKDLLLWDDFSGAPQDWQKNVIDGTTLFWVKVEVVSGFSTAPIGSQITAISEIQALSIRR